ncbi:MAG: hypothetical protein BA862_00210 [Desulfobulbaceae bacterium S3730MH12]|nr:MAG: hypothetical protein BA862_00210 [Desulfobulbaceae bacterium S3730MH12]OEU83753.1 MAG: hypothetical protein BA873_02750 [Desulfobulbaceae bacterium C00003063]
MRAIRYFLEASTIQSAAFAAGFFGNNFEFSKVPESSFSGMFFRHNHMQTDQEESLSTPIFI